MPRGHKLSFTMPDGRVVGYSLKRRNGYLRVQFPDPDTPGRYREIATGCTSKADAYTEAAKIILKHYADKIPDPKKVSWDDSFEALPHDLRPRTKDIYRSAVGLLRAELPQAKGPGDISPETAKLFRLRYGNGVFKRSNKSTANTFHRSPKTVENAIRRLSGYWSHLKQAGFANSNPWEGVSRPKIPKKPVVVPEEDTVQAFYAWLKARYPEWLLPRLFVTVKALAGCRTLDLCLVKSSQLRDGGLVIEADQDKTHRQRTIPLPPDVLAPLTELKGAVWLWESYTTDAKKHRPGSRNQSEFKPHTLYWAINNMFREFNESRPGQPKLLPHAFRRRAITRMVTMTQSVDVTAQAIGIDPATARRYYLDASQAFDAQEALRRAADFLRPGE